MAVYWGAEDIPGLRDNNVVYGFMGLSEPCQADAHDHWNDDFLASLWYLQDVGFFLFFFFFLFF